MDGCPDPVVAEERAELERTEEEDKSSSTETNDDREEGDGVVVVVRVIAVRFVVGVVGIQVPQQTAVREGVTNSVHDEDRDNQQCEDLVGEPSSVLDVPCDVEEGCQEAVSDQPD
mmetsp:Transcript_60911/g.149142  ORF Transcript_60911/g.149142 Transcript_60911/m.149142 type:complete len:115 (-) Transcript_60911:1558-1902(-)